MWDRSTLVEPEGGTVERWWLTDLAAIGVLLPLGAVSLFLWNRDNTVAALGVALGPLLVMFLVAPRTAIYAYCAWQAWDAAIVFGGGPGAWITPAKLLSVLVLVAALTNAWRVRIDTEGCRGILLWSLGFGIAGLVSASWAYDKLLALRLTLQILTQVALMLVIVALAAAELAHVRRLLLWTAIGGVTASAYLLVFGLQQGRFERATLSTEANPAGVGGALATAFAVLPALWVSSRSSMVRLGLILGGTVILAGIMTTGTRAALGGVLLAVILSPIFSIGRHFLKRLLVLFLLCAGLYGLGAAVLYSGFLSDQASTRLAKFLFLPPPNPYSHWIHEPGARLMVWGWAMQGYLRAGLLGSGLGNAAWAALYGVGVYKDVHSNVFGALVEMGPIGLAAFAGLHVAAALAIRRMLPSLRAPAWILLISCFAVGAVHTTYTSKLFWVPITFVAVLGRLSSAEIRRLHEEHVSGRH